MFADWEYWGRPVPNFGDEEGELLVVGLAPAAHGANRTGRMFTGDQSGLWLYRALERAGFANQAKSESRNDGMKLKGALITAVCHCAPPDNKPSPEELKNCRPFLSETMERMESRKVILALGSIAWNSVWEELSRRGELSGRRITFAHGAEVQLSDGRGWLLGSYHPSQQNTFTGRLTEPQFDNIFSRCRELLSR
jgi:uracil-DNA glycosylase family 4